MAFKENEDFARFLTMGAYATGAVSNDLERHGHRIIELERYAKANKIWTTKVKRLRLADLLCIHCGRRFESKGKSKLELKLSHSGKTPGREWWAGMRQDDVFAFVRAEITDRGPNLGRIAYVTRRALHSAEPSLKEGVRKAIADGAEPDVSWPGTVPKQGGVVLDLDASGKKLMVRKDDGRRQTYSGARWAAYYTLRSVGERFEAGDLLASCVEPAEVGCAGDVWDWRSDLLSGDQDLSFPAVKAARFRDPGRVTDELRAILEDSSNDWRVRLEAAASSAPVDNAAVVYMRARATAADAKQGEQMEAVFALSELDTDAAVQALVAIANTPVSVKGELRAAAVWGLGLGARPSPELLLPLLADQDSLVALHAAAAMPSELPESLVVTLLGWVTGGEFRKATTASHLLARHGQARRLLQAAGEASQEARAVALLAIGDAGPREIGSAIDSLDPATNATLRTLWTQRHDWLRAPDTRGGLDALERQRVRL